MRAEPFDPWQEPPAQAAIGRAPIEPWKLDRGRGTGRRASGRRLLFAASRFTRSVHALQRACELARRMHGTLFVLHVAPARAPRRAPGEYTVEAERAIAQAALGSVRRAGGPADLLLARDHLLLQRGDFTRVVAATARELEAELVILAGGENRKGIAAADIAQRAQVPVLVARRSAHGGGIVAATDFADPSGEELRHAAALAAQMPGGLAFVHNVKPEVDAAATRPGHRRCTRVEPSAQCLAQCRARLQALAEFFGVRADALVLSRPSAEDAILEAARDKDADLIVVGARRQGWGERLFGTALAARIVDQSDRSVLVVAL